MVVGSLVATKAADNPTTASFLDFSGGLNDYQAPMYIAKNESPDLLNVVVDQPLGVLKQRNGYESCGVTPSGNPATALYEFTQNDGSRSRIVSDNANVWATTDCSAYTTIVNSLSSLSRPRFATINNRLWIVNGVNFPYVWDGSTGYFLDGTNSHPTAPKGKFIAYWKSRVFLSNTPTEPSGVYFSQLSDDDGNVLDPAVSTGAWSNALNLLFINRGDGSPIYGTHLYRDNLYVFKETGVNRIIFESDYSIQIGKNVTSIGCKFDEAIVEGDDGLLRYPGKDGLYAFNGVVASLISTKWTNLYESIQQPSRSELFYSWNSGTKFSAGTLSQTKVVGDNVYVDVSTNSAYFLDDLTSLSAWTQMTGYKAWVLDGTGNGARLNAAGTGLMYRANHVTNNGPYGEWKITTLLPTCDTSCNEEFQMQLVAPSTVSLNVNGLSIRGDIIYGVNGNVPLYSLLKHVNGSTTTLATWTYDIGGQGVNWTIKAKKVGTSMEIVVTGNQGGAETTVANVTDTSPITVNANYFLAWAYSGYKYVYINDVYVPQLYGLGTITSDIHDIGTVATQWNTLGYDCTSVGAASCSVAYRVGTSAADTLTKSWTTILSGGLINATTDQHYLQWTSTINASSDLSESAYLSNVSIGWVIGSNITSPMVGIRYKGRYWMAFNTDSNYDYNNYTVMESKPPLTTYTKFDLPITAFAIWDNNLYGAIGGTSKIVRLDYGYTDDGVAIHSYWTSRDEMCDSPYAYKSINYMVADYSNSPANPGLSIGLTPNMGSTYQNRTLNISTSVLPRNTTKLNYDANRALGFRAKIDNTQLGIGYRIYGLHMFGTTGAFIGN